MFKFPRLNLFNRLLLVSGAVVFLISTSMLCFQISHELTLIRGNIDNELTEHLKLHKHDNMARRGLIQMVGKRKRLLKYLENTNFDAYKKVLDKLGLRK